MPKQQIGKRIGRAIPWVKVTYIIFNKVEYLKLIIMSGPEYKFRYC